MVQLFVDAALEEGFRVYIECYFESAHGLRPDVYFIEAGILSQRLTHSLYRLSEALIACFFGWPHISLRNGMDSLNICLFDVDGRWALAVHFAVQLAGKLGDIDLLREVHFSQRGLPRHIEAVRQVFKSHQDLILADWKQSIGALGLQILPQIS